MEQILAFPEWRGANVFAGSGWREGIKVVDGRGTEDVEAEGELVVIWK